MRHAVAPEHGPVRQEVPAQFAGTWSGIVHQTNPVLSLTVPTSCA